MQAHTRTQDLNVFNVKVVYIRFQLRTYHCLPFDVTRACRCFTCLVHGLFVICL